MTQPDLLIKNTLIVNGSGNAPYYGNIAVQGDRIVDVSETAKGAACIIDGSGLVTCPGFIDPHSHADLGILTHPPAENLVMQGITTFIGGNCGFSWAPVEETTHIGLIQELIGSEIPVNWQSFSQWLSFVEKSGTAVNYAPIVGHLAIRCSVMGEDFQRSATHDEITEMTTLLAESMESGALGFSHFADPGPCEYAATEELMALATEVKKYNGFFIPHTRHIQSQWPADDPNEHGYGIFHGPVEDVWVGRYRGYLEAIDISRRTGVSLHIAHLCPAFLAPQPHPDYLDAVAAQATVAIIDEAINDGIDLTFDVIPCSSGIAGKVPMILTFARWVDHNGNEGLMKKMKTAAFREQLHMEYERGRFKIGMIHPKADPYWTNRFKILACKNKAVEEKTIEEIARDRNTHPLNVLIDIVIEDQDAQWVQFEDNRMLPAAITVMLEHPLAIPSTDTLYVVPVGKADTLKNQTYGIAPIMFGLYPHYIETYVKENATLTLEEAVRRATAMPAKRFGLKDRGVLRQGAYADIVMFDLAKLRMTGDFHNPAAAPGGIEYTIVNGRIVYDGQAHTGALPGKVLRRE